MSAFAEIASVLGLSAVAGALAVRLRQPLLVAYILVGILVGPAGLALVTSHDQIALLAQVGVAVLLFLVGLKLDLQHVRHIGPVALATGLGQLAFTIVLGFFILLLLGKDWVTALYVAVALTFSSTIIIVKLLSDKRELETLHGRIAVGFLIVQDIAVLVAVVAMSAVRGSAGQSGWGIALSLLGRLMAAGLLTFVLTRFVLPRVLGTLARSQELLLIFAVAWGTAMAAFGGWMGFSKEVGAFVAGFSIASTSYREMISARLISLRDFLLLFFFIDLGANLHFATIGNEIATASVLSLFVLIGNPLIVMVIMGYMGYRARTGFFAGLTVAQISEFSIIFVSLGITLGHVGEDALGLTTIVGLITIMLSTYMILYSHVLYDSVAPALRWLERRRPFREQAVEGRPERHTQADVLIVGLGRYGSRLARQLSAHGVDVLGVDFDPEVVRDLRRHGLRVHYGDGESPEFLETLPLEHIPWVVCTVPDAQASNALLAALTRCRYGGKVAVVTHQRDDARATHPRHRVHLLNPYRDGADFAALDLVARIAGRPGEVEPPDLASRA